MLLLRPLALGLALFLVGTLQAAGPANRPFAVENYQVRLTLDPARDPERFSAEVEIRLKATAPLSQVELDREELDIRKVTERGRALPVDTVDPKKVVVMLAKPLAAGKKATLLIAYDGKVRTENNGLFKVRDPDDASRGPLIFTHFEATSARQFYPCDDEPYHKATTETLVTVPEGITVVSNGRLVSDRKKRIEGAPWHVVHWKMDKPQSTYLLSLAIGKFKRLGETVNGKPIGFYVGEKKAPRALYALESTRKSLAFFEEYLGVAYPWPKYDQIGVPTFLWGGMENTTATHMNEERFLLTDASAELEKPHVTGLVAHELAHQWFGDYVTMKWWDDVWLNESFASLMGTLATSHVFGTEEAEIDARLDAWDGYFRQEDGPRSHPIVSKIDSPDDGFDSINYTKGENVLRMLSFHIGEDKFRQGVARYLKTHAYGNAGNEDLFAALEQVSGEDLKDFRQSWLLSRGYPIIRWEGEWKKKDGSYALKITQRPNHAEDKTVFHFRLPVALRRKATPAYHKIVVVPVNAATASIEVKVEAEPEWVSVNPSSQILARVEMASQNEDRLAREALEDPIPLARVKAAYDLMQGLLDGKSVSSTAEKTLLAVAVADRSRYVRAAVLKGFQRMKTRYLPSRIGDGIFAAVRERDGATSSAASPRTDTDPDQHGRLTFHGELLATLGKVDRDDVLPYLAAILARPQLSIDDLNKAARSVAATGSPQAAEMLRDALALHGPRGYKYRFAVLYAYGSYESPGAVKELAKLAKTATPDFWGRIGWIIANNQTLKASPEWAAFLRDFVLENATQGDEVKSRLLQSVEEVKNRPVEETLKAIVAKASSQRMRETAKRMLEKNFADSAKT